MDVLLSRRLRVDRRKFLKSSVVSLAGVAFTWPTVILACATKTEAPSNRITVGCIGIGRMGLRDMRSVLAFDSVQVVAVCDVDSKRVDHARKIVEERYGGQSRSGIYKGCAAYGDFRQLVARDDIDAVLIATPDHWHALPAVAAAKAGKDIFLQKPLTRTVREGRILSDTVRRSGSILLVGSQQRSDARFRYACELVRNKRIGKLRTVKVFLAMDPGTSSQPAMPVPENLDYDMWLGPAPWVAYTEKRAHPQEGYSRPGWLRISDYCCGMITGWGSHHLDIAQWGIGTETGGPVEVEGWAEYPEDGLWDVHGRFRVLYSYANGVKVICTDNTEHEQGVLFQGTEGWVYVRRGFIQADPPSMLGSQIGPNETRLYRSDDHKANFLECVRTRRQPVAPVEVGHRSNTVCLLGYIAMKLGRKLKWDAEHEQFINDTEANKLLSKPMRSPWQV